jgi:hypothetical protein
MAFLGWVSDGVWSGANVAAGVDIVWSMFGPSGV